MKSGPEKFRIFPHVSAAVNSAGWTVDEKRLKLVHSLMAARRAVREAKRDSDVKAEAAAHKAVDRAKTALGERGSVWWTDGSPDLNRHMAKNTAYAEWYSKVGRSRPGEN